MKTRKTAFTFAEVLIGVAIVLFVIVGMNGVFGVGIRGNKKAENTYIALGYAQELMEKIIIKDFSTIISGIPESTSDGFTKNLQVTYPYDGDSNKKLITVTIQGPDIRDVKLSYMISNSTLEVPVIQ
jgi:type II secretory pathway pseudopilin PulG